MVRSVRLCPKTEKARKHFLQIEGTPPNSPPISSFEESSDNISLDTIHWKMLVKVLMCCCFVQGFHEEGNEYLKKLCHFYCECKEKHEYFVYTRKSHPFINKRMDEMQHKCTCKILGSYETCNFCVQVKYLINFGAYKINTKKWEQYENNTEKYAATFGASG